MSEDDNSPIAQLAMRRASAWPEARTLITSNYEPGRRDGFATFHWRGHTWRHPIEHLQSTPPAATASNGSTNQRPRMNDAQIEQAIQAKGLTAPRVTHDDLMDNITDVEYVKHVSKSGQVLRWAVITTRNGFAVTGRPSCSVSAANDDEELGKDVAFSNAKGELWPLMGYELRSRLAATPTR